MSWTRWGTSTPPPAPGRRPRIGVGLPDSPAARWMTIPAPDRREDWPDTLLYLQHAWTTRWGVECGPWRVIRYQQSHLRRRVVVHS